MGNKLDATLSKGLGTDWTGVEISTVGGGGPGVGGEMIFTDEFGVWNVSGDIGEES